MFVIFYSFKLCQISNCRNNFIRAVDRTHLIYLFIFLDISGFLIPKNLAVILQLSTLQGFCTGTPEPGGIYLQHFSGRLNCDYLKTCAFTAQLSSGFFSSHIFNWIIFRWTYSGHILSSKKVEFGGLCFPIPNLALSRCYFNYLAWGK